MVRYMLLLLYIFVALSSSDAQIKQAPGNVEVVKQWSWIDFNWPEDTRKQAIANGSYIPKNIIISDVDFFEDDIILALPRLRTGVPFTLASTKVFSEQKSPPLSPFPRRSRQIQGSCDDLQNIYGFEVDSYGRLWVLDSGSINILEDKIDVTCPSKLVIFDLMQDTHPQILSHVFARTTAPQQPSLLSDLALKQTGPGEEDWVAYISDSINFGIIVFNLKKTSSYRITDSSMASDPVKSVFKIKNHSYNISSFGVHGMAYNRRRDLVYYTAVGSDLVYSVNASLLANKAGAQNPKLLKYHTKLEGSSGALGGAMCIDNKGLVYLGLLGINKAVVWNPIQPLSPNVLLPMIKDNQRQWLTALKVHNCFLYSSSSRLQKLFDKERLKKNAVNHRILRAYTGTQSSLNSSQRKQCRTLLPRAKAEAIESRKLGLFDPQQLVNNLLSFQNTIF